MNRTQRFVYFGMGVAVGVLVIMPILRKRAEAKRDRDAVADRRHIPGMLLDFAKDGFPVYDERGKGVLESSTGPGAEGFARTRRVLTGGRPRFDDATGAPLPAEFLAITEYYAEPGEPGPASRVARYDFAYADRVAVEVKAPADTAAVSAALKPLGGRLTLVPGSRTNVLARFEKPSLATVDRALAALAAVPGVVSARPVKLDWKSELVR